MPLVVDTPATYTVLPRKVLESLGVSAKSRVEIVIADGSVIYRDMGEVRMKFNGEVMFVPVIFGEAGDVTVLGVTALEIFRLTVDAVNQRLVPTRLLWLVYYLFRE